MYFLLDCTSCSFYSVYGRTEGSLMRPPAEGQASGVSLAPLDQTFVQFLTSVVKLFDAGTFQFGSQLAK
uniref:Uncharacterized protein n=1 Tax=Bracon brevicornis TaxID=1563983 RepID=A0A6V7HNW7_9HYME